MSETNNDLFFDVQEKTDKQHILDNPDTYIGSIENIESNMWILNENNKMIEKNIHYNPGLYKLFDEGIVNCRDHAIRMKGLIEKNTENALPVTHIDIHIENDGTITMVNDGNGIDIAKKNNVWIPELVFGHLRTSTNYNKDEKRIVGGKNGYGFKLVLIWSTYGRIETVDHIRGLKYIQEFKNNLDEICSPNVTKCKTKPYTKITFKPDYHRLGISGLSPDMIQLLKKRVYDISAITEKHIKVRYNGDIVPIKNFEQYFNMYIGEKSESQRVYEENGERWEYAVALTPTSEFIQISFVNGIHTSKGGKHVEYILNQITKKLVDLIEKKKKTKVNPNTIKEQLILFLRCDIENPSFDSQTKDYMNTPMNKFGSRCEVTDKFIEKVAKMGVMEHALELTEVKESKAAKKTDGTKNKSVRGIPKLTDANWAGTDKSSECTLILCEGDSAKAGIISGLQMEDRNVIGIYPLKGKLLNVRGESQKKILENKEITEIKKILGLVTNKEYKNIQDVYQHLRYGKILIMTDQDSDGSHIKALCVNLFACEWPSLAEIPGFIGFMNTPILKATLKNRKSDEIDFYNNGEYDEWKEKNNVDLWSIKYFKGLGTSTQKQFKEYMKNRKIVEFETTGETSKDVIDMVFNKKRADDRKEWLKYYDRKSFLDTSKKVVSYEEFINRELIHFSKYDCDRSIPNLMDGLKISQRKIIYAAFKRNFNTEAKVAQFSGYVSEHSLYHHGEASLNSTIVGMAQNFVGSNNINLLLPNGQFGTRLQGGKDSASERYIYTMLNKITRHIFQQADDAILEYLDDDGVMVEPTFYAPILPMVLVNGAKGIGTGFSTDIMCYNPIQIMDYLKNKLSGEEEKNQLIEFVPYYNGFKGNIRKIGSEKYLIKGLYEKIGVDKIKVTELPVGYWTDDFKELLEELCTPSEDKDKKRIPASIMDYNDMSTDSNVEFHITFPKGKLEELEKNSFDNDCNGVEKILKLFTTNTATNMHLFDANDKLRKFDSVSDIIDNYFDVRLQLYQTRKAYIIQNLEKELVCISNKVKYIKENLEGTIDLRRKSKEQVNEMLERKGYDKLNSKDGNNENNSSYHYLIKMPMDSVTQENIDKLTSHFESKTNELENIRNTSINAMWLNELNILEQHYNEYITERINELIASNEEVKDAKKPKKIVKKAVKKMKFIVENDDENK